MAMFTLTPTKSQVNRAKNFYSPAQMKAIADEWEEVKKAIIEEDKAKAKKKEKEVEEKGSVFRTAILLTVFGPPFFIAWTYSLQYLAANLSNILR